jgi:hypothetical protein
MKWITEWYEYDLSWMGDSFKELKTNPVFMVVEVVVVYVTLRTTDTPVVVAT